MLGNICGYVGLTIPDRAVVAATELDFSVVLLAKDLLVFFAAAVVPADWEPEQGV